MSNVAELDPRLSIGGNNPPEPTPFEQSRDEIESLYLEATNWCDGTAIETQAQADEISRLVDLLRKASKAADERRVAEKKPLDEQVAEIQARYNPLIQKDKGKVDMAIAALKKAVAPYLQKLEDEKRAKAVAAQKEAEEKLAAAHAAMIASRESADLAERENAERLAAEAKAAEKVAIKASNDKAAAKGGTRAMTLRSVWTATLVDPTAALRHYWTSRRPELEKVAQDFADADVRSGARSIPGFEITESKVPV